MANDNFENFPEALKNDEVNQLFAEYHLGNKNALDKIIEHNLRLVIYIVKNNFNNTSISFDDLFSIGTYGLFKACRNFDEKKGIKFATYATRVITNEILMAIRREKKHERVSSYNVVLGDENEHELIEIIAGDENIEELYLNSELKTIIEKVLANETHLTSTEKKVVNYYFGINGYPPKNQREISNILNISQSYVSRIFKKAIIKIRVEIRKYGYQINDSKTKKYIEISSQSLYSIFPENTREEIDEVIKTFLTEAEKKILLLRFGNDLENPQEAVDWDNKKNNQYFGIILPKIKRNLAKLNQEKRQSNWNSLRLTIYDILKPYSKKEIDSAISDLDESEKELLKKYYGTDFSVPNLEIIELEESEKDLLKLITQKIIDNIIKKRTIHKKIEIQLADANVPSSFDVKPENTIEQNITKEVEKSDHQEKITNKFTKIRPKSIRRIFRKKIKSETSDIQKTVDFEENKLEPCELYDFWQDETFIEYLKECSWEEITIISLKFGIASVKCFSIFEIAVILDLNPEYVKNIIYNVLIGYQTKINDFLGNSINDIGISRTRKN